MEEYFVHIILRIYASNSKQFIERTLKVLTDDYAYIISSYHEHSPFPKILKCMCICACLHQHTGVHGGRRFLKGRKLHNSVLGTELRSSARTACTTGYRPSPQPQAFLF